MATKQPCKEPGCDRPKKETVHRCYWHWLLLQPIEYQVQAAEARLKSVPIEKFRPRVPVAEWPDGERWCSGCQWMVPLFYAQGSRCKACNSRAAHASRLVSVYGISEEDYRAMLEIQGGRCYVCQRRTKKRLAVDHDHVTGTVRGLLCADNERGCNHALLGNIKDVEMARRIVAYLEDPPMDRVARARAAPTEATPWPQGPPVVVWTLEPGWLF